MPFVKTKEGVLWQASSPDDVRKVRDEILNPPVVSKDEPNVSLDKALKERIENTLSTVIPGYGLEILGGANEKLYKFIKEIDDPNRPPVDIIIPVHGAIHIAEKCIEAAISRTFYPHHITIVDDASDKVTHDILASLAACYDRVDLITNKKNRGFAATVNRGIRQTESPYIVLLNSDVLVTDYWLTKMMLALKDHPRNMIVNPATNNTALINVPLSPGCNYITANKIFEKYTHHNYPEIMPTGFCFLFPRELIAKVGYLDEAYKNFGEEAIWVKTPVRTTKGWSTVGDLKVGDKVFSVEGIPTSVMKTTSVFKGRPCYSVTMRSGESIVADEGHKWEIFRKGTNNSRNRIRVTTSKLVPNDWIRVPDPIQFPNQHLIVDPYLLGAWLGDGDTNGGKITTADTEIIGAFRSCGFKPIKQKSTKYGYHIGVNMDRRPRRSDGTFSGPDPHSFKNLLDCLGVLDNKHIPYSYINSSVDQRLSLVQGLMDTDGSCDKNGRCVFANTNTRIIANFRDILSSLGIRSSVTSSRKKHYKVCYKVTFRSHLPVFRLKRKLDRQKINRRDYAFFQIASVKKTESHPVKCISVAHPEHLFLIGRELIPTSNSHMWMQTLTHTEGSSYPRYRAVMADDTYCFHERGSSFTGKEDELEHMSIRKTSSARFHKVWPQYAHWRKTYNTEKALGNLRSIMPPNMINEESVSSDRICWVVRATRSRIGAMKYISDIVNEINERGGDARVAHVLRGEVDKTKIEVLPELRTAPIVFDNDEDFLNRFEELVFNRGTVVASTVEMANMVKELTDKTAKLKPMLHVQSYEPYMTEDPKAQSKFRDAFKSIPDVISSSKWITKVLEDENLAQPFATIPPGVEQKLYYLRDRESGDERPTVMVPINKEYPHRGADRAVKLVNALIKQSVKRKQEIRILCPGVDVVQNADFTVALGNLPQTRMAKVLATEVDVFVDPSHIHSYGLPCLEAIASGTWAVSWDNRGINEYLTSGDAGVIVPNSSKVADVATMILDRLQDPEKLPPRDNKHRTEILREHDREVSVNQFIEATEKQMDTSAVKNPKRIVFVTPHLRKWGGPTTILSMANEIAKRGHDVSITSVYSDINPSVIEETDLPIDLNPHDISKCDVLVSNSDNPMNAAFMEMQHCKKKIMFKMSHNPRFKQLENDSLKLGWDSIVTTTDWLVDACKTPHEGWDHPSKEAKRVGWFHYGHNHFNTRPEERKYGDGKDTQIVVATLIHRHPLKGSKEAIGAMSALQKKYEGILNFIGIGEVPLRSAGQPVFKPPPWMTYVQSPTRDELVQYLRQVDVWIGASHTEGLGRMALEAMSCSVACVLTDTGAEFAVDGENCLLSPINDAQKLYESVDYLVSNPEVRARMQQNGYATATMYADPSSCIDDFEAAIYEVCGGS